MEPVGQARTASKVAKEARDLAALWVDGDPSDFEVVVRFVLPKQIEVIRRRAEEAERQGRADLHRATQLRREAVRSLLKHGITRGDTATVLGISVQRVRQLA